MSSYSPNFTARYKIKYRCGASRHATVFRFAGNLPEPTPDFVGAVGLYLSALSTIRYNDWIVEDAEYAQQGSDVFLPAPSPDEEPGEASPVGRTLANLSVNVNSGGRSFLNNSTRVFIYGVNVNPFSMSEANDFRIQFSEEPWTATAYTALNILAGFGWCAADGNPISYVRRYHNVAVSAYRQRKARASL